MIAGVNRNLAQDGGRLEPKQVEQMQRTKTKVDTAHAGALSLVHKQMRRVQMYCLLHGLFSKRHLQRCLMWPTEAMTCLFSELITSLNTSLKSTAASTGPAYIRCLRQGCEIDVYNRELDKQVLVTLLCRADKQQNVDSLKEPWALTSVWNAKASLILTETDKWPPDDQKNPNNSGSG